MSAKKNKKRTSILKRRKSEDVDEATITQTKKLMFSAKSQVLEYVQCNEKAIVWGDKYETSVNSDGSGNKDGALSTSRQTTDFDSMQTSSSASQFVVATDFDSMQTISSSQFVVSTMIEEKQSIEPVNRLSDEIKTPEMSIIMNSMEYQKIKELTPTDHDLTKIVHHTDKNDSDNKDVTVSNIASLARKSRGAVNKVDANRTVSIVENEENIEPANSNSASITLQMDISHMQASEQERKIIFKCPKVPFSQSSPPIKQINDCCEKVDDIYDMLIKDTPNKNLCCLTPQRSASKPSDSRRKQPETRKSISLFREMGFIDGSNTPSSSQTSQNTTNVSNITMNITSGMEGISGSMETSAELMKQVERLVKNPNATLRTLARPSLSISQISNVADMSIDISSPAETFAPKARSTVYEHREMTLNQSDEETYQISRKSLIKASYDLPGMDEMSKTEIPQVTRATIFNNNDMDESVNDKTSRIIPASLLVSQSDRNRPTTFKLDDMDESVNEKTLKKIPTSLLVSQSDRNRPTTFKLDDMDESVIEKTSRIIPASLLVSQKGLNKNRATVFDVENIDETQCEEKIEKNVKGRSSIFDGNKMEQSVSEKHQIEPKVVKNRATIYDQNSMDVSMTKTLSSETPVQVKHRGTVFAHNDMEQSVVEEKKLQSFKNRGTIFAQNDMDETLCPESSVNSKGSQNIDENVMEQLKCTRKERTFFNQNEIDETLTMDNPVTSKSHQSDRKTIFDQNAMDQSTNDNFLTPKIPLNSRDTIFHQTDIDQTFCGENSKNPVSVNNRATIFNHDVMEQSVTEKVAQNVERHPIAVKNRATIFSNEDMEQSPADKVNIITKNRATFFDQQQMDESTSHIMHKEEKIQPTLQSVSLMSIPDYSKCFTPKDTSSELSLIAKKDENPPALVYENDVKMKNRQTTFQSTEMEQSTVESHLHQSIIANEEIIDVVNELKTRMTVHKLNDMDLSGIDELKNENSSDFIRNKIFTPPSGFKTTNQTLSERKSVIVENNAMEVSNHRNTCFVAEEISMVGKSFGWNNVTDADLLDDDKIIEESDPCIETITDTCSIAYERKINDGNVTRYEDALSDFINITINASPLSVSIKNESFHMPTDMNKSRRLSRPLSPVRDYGNMLDNLITDLKKKNQPKPRLAIDEYLEQMRIEPVKIKLRSDHTPEAIFARINAKKEHMRKKREEREKRRAEIDELQFPKIPSVIELMRNKLDTEEEEMYREATENFVHEPIFPELYGFEYLLTNKFKTDPHLLQHWILDTTWWSQKNLKLTHKSLPFLTFNIKCQQSMDEADNSSIPIIFNKILLYLAPNYRNLNSMSHRYEFLRKEFRKAIGFKDDLTAMCKDSSELFSFLDLYHDRVMRTVEMVKNFYHIVHNYRGIVIYGKDYGNLFTVFKTVFCANNKDGYPDAVEIKIPVHTYIDEIKLEDIAVKSQLFIYEVLSNGSAKSMEGLMLLEYVLFDTEKFMEGNVQARRQLY